LKHKDILRAAGAVGAVGLVAVAVAGGSATASPSAGKQGGAALITMEKDGKKLFFEGPETVAPGQKLKIQNLTNPRQVGPHTFSLVGQSTLPETNKEIRKCSRQFAGICGAIAKWHKVDLESGEVGRNPVKTGADGWDRAGNLKRKGDSWVSEKENQSFAQEVTAPEGKVLHFICAVHAEMQGEIRVEG
jgi:plastocyanin